MSEDKPNQDPYQTLAQPFLKHYDLLRGLVRYELAARQLDQHLPEPPARIIDVGGGAGHQTFRLAERGYTVVLADPSEEMLDRAGVRLTTHDKATRGRVELVRADANSCAELYAGDEFDAALCQGVVMYLPSSEPVIQALAKLVKPGGIVSLIAKNAEALAMRPALEGRYADAVRAFAANSDLGGVGIVTRGDTLDSLSDSFKRCRLELVAWYGIRVFTDHLANTPPGDNSEIAVEAELRAGQTDPYRRVARLLHLIGRREEASR